MKTKYIKAFIGLIPALGMASCMDFDTPSDEFTGSQVDSDIVLSYRHDCLSAGCPPFPYRGGSV